MALGPHPSQASTGLAGLYLPSGPSYAHAAPTGAHPRQSQNRAHGPVQPVPSLRLVPGMSNVVEWPLYRAGVMVVWLILAFWSGVNLLSSEHAIEG